MLTFYPDFESQWRLATAIIVLFTLPGLTLITWLPKEWGWDALSKWCLAIGFSLALYPVLLYALRLVAPIFGLTLELLIVGLSICAVIFVIRIRKSWAMLFRFTLADGAAILVFGFTLATRFWLIRDQPFPASPDSLHHTLITQLVAQAGRLPETLDPYFQIPLAMYHLGLYALTGMAQLLSGAPAHMVVLWVAQVLNGLCGVGLYLLLKHRVNHTAGIIGAVIVGLLSFQPAWLSSWGRFTVVASGTLLPFAWLLTLLAIDQWNRVDRLSQISIFPLALSAIFTAAIFLLHYRVAGYYLPLLAFTLLWELIRAYNAKSLVVFFGGVIFFSLITLVLISPALWSALWAYTNFSEQNTQLTALNSEQRALYFDYPLSWLTELGARPWLWFLTAISGIWGIWQRRWMITVSVLWLFALWLEGNAYLLGVPFLAFTNMSAILISLYLPIGIVVGSTIGDLWSIFSTKLKPIVKFSLVLIFVIGSLVGGLARAQERIEPYYFVTQSDVAAMNWIIQNTPPEARFAVNTHFFSSNFAHGTDAGYWIPYFTQRVTSSGTMLLPLGAPGYVEDFLAKSRIAQNIENDLSAVGTLRDLGIDYIYVGKRGNQISPGGFGLSVDKLRGLPNIRVIYERDGVTILEIE